RCSRLPGPQEVVQIGARIPSGACRARTTLEDRLVGLAPPRPRQIHSPTCRRVGNQRHAVTPEPRRHGAVETIDAQLNALYQVVDIADPQQVTGPSRTEPVELGRGPRDDLVHLRPVAAEAASG